MKRTVNKEAIESYIHECINFDDASLNELSFDWKLAKVYHDFKMQMMGKRHDMKRPINEQDLFVDWMQGLPTGFNIEFRTFEQIELMEEWNVAHNPDRSVIASNIFYYNVMNVFYELLERYDIN